VQVIDAMLASIERWSEDGDDILEERSDLDTVRRFIKSFNDWAQDNEPDIICPKCKGGGLTYMTNRSSRCDRCDGKGTI
jgi:uncharacterized phage protein